MCFHLKIILAALELPDDYYKVMNVPPPPSCAPPPIPFYKLPVTNEPGSDMYYITSGFTAAIPWLLQGARLPVAGNQQGSNRKFKICD